MHAEPGWDLYRTFLTVMREGSLAAAARALELSQPTAGRHIESLERALGVSLFTRSPNGLTPTDAAAAIAPYAQGLEAAAAALLRACAGSSEQVAGIVRVTASEVIAVEVLPAIVAKATREFPRLQIELVATNRVEDLLRREADIAVRMVRPAQQALVAKRLADVELGLHAHPGYLRGKRIRGWKDLEGLDFVGPERLDPVSARIAEGIPVIRKMRAALRTESQVAQLAAIRAGAGIGICQVALARRDPKLTRLLPAFAPSLEMWVTMHEDLRTNPRCRATFDALVKGLAGGFA